jgi:hypothetical protein
VQLLLFNFCIPFFAPRAFVGFYVPANNLFYTAILPL